MSNSFFGNTMENVRNYRDIKIIATNKERNRLVLEPNYRTTKSISENLLIREMKNTKLRMIKPLYLRLSILGLSKTIMYEFQYGDKSQLCYIDIDSFVIYFKTEYFYKNIANDVERWFDTSNYDKNDKRPPPLGKNKK